MKKSGQAEPAKIVAWVDVFPWEGSSTRIAAVLNEHPGSVVTAMVYAGDPHEVMVAFAILSRHR